MSKARLGWQIANVTKTEADVDIFDVIGDPWDGVSAADFVKQIRGLKVDRLNFYVNSPGGYVNDAIAMFNAVKAHPAETNAYVIGSADSAASFLVQAMDNRYIADNASMFIHRAQGFAFGDEDDAAALVEMLHESSVAIAQIYADRAGGTVDEWLTRMSAPPLRGTQYRGQGAVDVGLADKVGLNMNRDISKVAALSGTPVRLRPSSRIAAMAGEGTLAQDLVSDVYQAFTDCVEEHLSSGLITVAEAMELTDTLGPILGDLETALASVDAAGRIVPPDMEMGMQKEGRPAAETKAPDSPDIDIALIPSLATGYKPPLPSDFTRLLEMQPRGA